MRIVICLIAGVLATAASARIQCDGPYQISGGERISTPYCEDGYLAAVARGYGARTSGDVLRNNPSEKERICHFVGADIRVRDTCAGFRNDGGRR